MRVFVSSTVYDLLDVRAEIFSLLRSLNLSPVLSDDKLSAFDVSQNANSIESCLLNVATSEVVVIVLDQRYGPRLGSVGFDDVSATHLEYRRARELKKPICFFVRDRLEADFTIWRKNGKKPDVELAWVRSTEHGLLDLVEEHRSLRADSRRNNWYSIFTNSLDLKESLQRFLQPRILPAQVTNAISENRFPLFDVAHDVTPMNVGHAPSISVKIEITNVGQSPAFNVSFSWSHQDGKSSVSSIIAPSRSTHVTLLSNTNYANDINTEMYVDYDSAIGVHVREAYDVVVCIVGGPTPSVLGGVTLKERRFTVGTPIAIKVHDAIIE